MYRCLCSRAHICKRLYSSVSHFNWPPPLPIAFPHNVQCPKLYEEWGRSVNHAALCSAITQRTDSTTAEKVLSVCASDSVTKVLALALPFQILSASSDPAETYYIYIGKFAEQQGISAAADWVTSLYSPFLRNTPEWTSTNLEHTVSSQPVSGIEVSAKPTPSNTSVQETKPEMKQLGPVDLSSSDDMNLFDPESWLTESPTAQKLWKQ